MLCDHCRGAILPGETEVFMCETGESFCDEVCLVQRVAELGAQEVAEMYLTAAKRCGDITIQQREGPEPERPDDFRNMI